jgi:hypothetical protein
MLLRLLATAYAVGNARPAAGDVSAAGLLPPAAAVRRRASARKPCTPATQLLLVVAHACNAGSNLSRVGAAGRDERARNFASSCSRLSMRWHRLRWGAGCVVQCFDGRALAARELLKLRLEAYRGVGMAVQHTDYSRLTLLKFLDCMFNGGLQLKAYHRHQRRQRPQSCH